MKSKSVWISCILATFFCGPAANSAVIMTLEQVGSNVVATGSGTVDPADLSYLGTGGAVLSQIQPSFAALVEGGGAFDAYSGISGPTSFGSGNTQIFPSSGTGDALGVLGFAVAREILVPHGYISDTPLSSTATWDNTTLTDLGVTSGTYTWTWGSGPHADSLTLYAGVPAPTSVPEPTPSLLLILGAAGLAAWTWRTRCRVNKTGQIQKLTTEEI